MYPRRDAMFLASLQRADFTNDLGLLYHAKYVNVVFPLSRASKRFDVC
ncbi:hypothetical protein [Dulcicalothrix desertica]|nr:hypothetical protein [Dulcicalothrix desertica]